MEINIFKEKDNLYFSVDEQEKKLMNFDNLVSLAERIVDLKDAVVYHVNSNDRSLDLYKTTIDELIKSLLSDAELLELLSEKQEN